jgi:hypothetical protein
MENKNKGKSQTWKGKKKEKMERRNTVIREGWVFLKVQYRLMRI